MKRRALMVAGTLALFSLGALLSVVVASAAPKKKPTTPTSLTPTTTTSPGDGFFVLNGTANASSVHVIVGSSAFPNFRTGAVDNYYAMAHAYVDNSPFAQGTASPADSGPIGQTAAAGNFQQPQYADARWPGKDSGKAAYGDQGGGPYAAAEAGEYKATAEASEVTQALSGPGVGGAKTLAVPSGFDLRLRQALAGWRSTFRDTLGVQPPAKPTVTTPVGPVTVPKAPKPGVKPPTATVTTPVATVTTPVPRPNVGAPTPVPVPPPPVTVPTARRQDGTRQLASLSSSSAPADGARLLESSSRVALVPVPAKAKPTTKSKTKTKAKNAKPKQAYALVTSGESSLGRVSIGDGQIVIRGIHVTASITNDGTPTYKSAVTVASATIGGIPVTIDEEGVHVSGQGQALPYQQASDALNSALKQAGIRIFLVGPDVKTNTCDQAGAGGGGAPVPAPTETTSDQPDPSGSCDQAGGMCDQSASGGSTTTTSTTSTTSTTPGSSCDQTGGSCSGSGSGDGGGLPGIGTTTPSSTTTTSSKPRQSTTETTTTSATSACGESTALPPPTTGGCGPTSTAGGTGNQASTTATTSTTTTDVQPFPGGDTSGAGALTVTATGVHVAFTQPVSPPGFPAQYVEHILGEVYLDSLATPAEDLPDLGLSSSSSSSSCAGGGGSAGSTSGSSSAGAGGSFGASGSSGASGTAFGSGSQPAAGATGGSLPAVFAAALRKPLWLLLAYLLWQAIVVGTGWSLWNWRRDGAA